MPSNQQTKSDKRSERFYPVSDLKNQKETIRKREDQKFRKKVKCCEWTSAKAAGAKHKDQRRKSGATHQLGRDLQTAQGQGRKQPEEKKWK